MMKKIIVTLVVFLLMFSSAVKADLQWRCAKNYTATLADGAANAAEAVVDTLQKVQDAKEYVENARLAVDGTRVTLGAAGTTGAVAATLQGATAVVETAEAGVAIAETAGAATVAVAVGATAGTLIGQGVNWLVSICWDPVCSIQSDTPDATSIYSGAATDEEVQSLIPNLVLQATGQTITIDDFTNAGESGETSLQFLSEGIRLFLGLARGAAAAADGRTDETLSAVTDLEAALAAFPATISDFATALQEATLESPVAALQSANDTYNGDELQVNETNGITELADLDLRTAFIDGFDTVGDSLDAAIVSATSATYSPLITSGDTQGLFVDLTSDRYQQFLADCGTQGSACLPPEEIAVTEALLTAAGVSFSDISDIGASIAAFDADTSVCPDTETSLSADANTTTQSLADVLSQSVSESSTSGSWLDIDLEESPVTLEAREASGTTETGGEATPSSEGSGCSLIMNFGAVPGIILLSFVALPVLLRKRQK